MIATSRQQSDHGLAFHTSRGSHLEERSLGINTLQPCLYSIPHTHSCVVLNHYTRGINCSDGNAAKVRVSASR